jgi:hypothetical protein
MSWFLIRKLFPLKKQREKGQDHDARVQLALDAEEKAKKQAVKPQTEKIQ